MNLFPPHFKSFYWIFSCVCATKFSFLHHLLFFGVKKSNGGYVTKKGNICGHTRGLCRILVGTTDRPISMEIEKKSWVNIDYYLYNAHSDRSVCSTDQDIKYANVPIYYYYHGFLPPPPFSFSATCICNMIVSRENLNFSIGQKF